MSDPVLEIALIEPEIPPNTGNVGRLVVGMQLRLHVVHPIGFRMDDKAVRRAGLDYWKHVDLVEHESLAAFLDAMEGRRLHLYSSRGTAPFTQADVQPGDVLVFGRESTGLPRDLVEERGAYVIPMTGVTRSLNLSNAVAVVTYDALRRVQPELF